MKERKKLLMTLLPAIAITAGLIILFAGKKRKENSYRKREQIAEEGYETAGDILFPEKNKNIKYRAEWN